MPSFKPPMTGNQLRQLFIDFYVKRGHQAIPSAPLIPQDDPTTLFTGSGMQPLVPYLLGEPHPLGKRLVNSQICFRAEDIDEVGDNRHTTFFEMLGNWSLGDYFKKEQLTWFFQFLTEVVGLDPRRLYVTVFSGDEKAGIPKDAEAVTIWKELFRSQGIEAKDVELIDQQTASQKGMQGGRIFYYNAQKNWWSRAGVPENMPPGEPGGPDSEVFYDFGKHLHRPEFGPHCHPNCDCGRFLEIGNSVFMQYRKTQDGGFQKLPQKNVDFGGGLERILAASQSSPDIFRTDLFWPIIQAAEKALQKSYQGNEKTFRILADHLKAAVFMIAHGLEPSNKHQGYVLRRLLRRVALKLYLLTNQVSLAGFSSVYRAIIDLYHPVYFSSHSPSSLQKTVEAVVDQEVNRFATALRRGLAKIEKRPLSQIDGRFAFNLFQSYGFPFELTQEILAQKGVKLDYQDFLKQLRRHQQRSRTAAKGIFKGGLADHSEAVTKLHTATHLLHAALRRVLGHHVHQVGSNITADRLRFDFTHPRKLTPSQLKKVEDLVNQQIKKDLAVFSRTLSLKEAKKQGALFLPHQTYPPKVKVYFIAPAGRPDQSFSIELCGGPHVQSTAVLGRIKIIKEEAAGSGVRRIYARLVNSHRPSSSRSNA